MKLVFSWVGVALLLVLAAGPACADITLTDVNSSVTILTNAGSEPYGMTSWLVDGANIMYEQWFWYRIGNQGGELPINTLGGLQENTSNVDFDPGNEVGAIRYSNGTLQVDIQYTLQGGALLSHMSDVAESITIRNLGTDSLDLHFFQYADFDLAGLGSADSARMVNANAVNQVGGGSQVSETVATPAPSHYSVAGYPGLRSLLVDGNPTTLNDLPALGTWVGPFDVAWAFEWDVIIAGGGSFQISKDKNYSVVPEPASILGLGTVLFLLGSRLRRRKQA